MPRCSNIEKSNIDPTKFENGDLTIGDQGSVERRETMLWTIILILLVLWALGFSFAGAATGNLIHVLLVVAVVVLILQLVRGRRV